MEGPIARARAIILELPPFFPVGHQIILLPMTSRLEHLQTGRAKHWLLPTVLHEVHNFFLWKHNYCAFGYPGTFHSKLCRQRQQFFRTSCLMQWINMVWNYIFKNYAGDREYKTTAVGRWSVIYECCTHRLWASGVMKARHVEALCTGQWWRPAWFMSAVCICCVLSAGLEKVRGACGFEEWRGEMKSALRIHGC